RRELRLQRGGPGTVPWVPCRSWAHGGWGDLRPVLWAGAVLKRRQIQSCPSGGRSRMAVKVGTVGDGHQYRPRTAHIAPDGAGPVVCVKFCKLAVMVLVMRLGVVRSSCVRAGRPC